MTVHISALSGLVLVYLLVFARVGAMVMLLPAIGNAGVPSSVRLVLALAIAYALGPQVASNYVTQAPTSVTQLVVLIAAEVTAGILVGGMSRIIMSALDVAGSLIATQSGLSYAQAFDPMQSSQSSVIGSFLSLLGAALIFSTNLHHLAIGAIVGSFRLMPPGAALPTGDMAELAIKLVSGSFALGFQLAAPFVVFGFAVSVGVGVLARLMPQLQVFFIATPINILFGFFLLMLLIGTMMTVFLNFYATSMAAFGA